MADPTVSDDEEPAHVALLAPRPLWLRPDVVPFLSAYACALGALVGRADLRDALAYLFPLIVVAHGLAVLATYWSMELRAAAHFRQVTHSSEATAVKVVPPVPGARRQLCRLLCTRAAPAAAPGAPAGGDAHFYWQRRKYVLVAEAAGPAKCARFERSAYPTDRPLGEYALTRGVQTAAAARAAAAAFGPNAFSIPAPSFSELYVQQLLAPFFVFQLFCVALWSLDDYWYYSLFTLAMLALFEGASDASARRERAHAIARDVSARDAHASARTRARQASTRRERAARARDALPSWVLCWCWVSLVRSPSRSPSVCRRASPATASRSQP